MKLEDQVCSLELAKKLKELGVKYESVYSWADHEGNFELTSTAMTKLMASRPKDVRRYEETYVSAFTVAELGEMLINADLKKYIELDYFTTDVFNLVVKQTKTIGFGSYYTDDKNEADARAKMLIYLIENKLINL